MSGKLPKKIAKEFTEAIRIRARAKSMDDEAKRLKDESNSILLPVMCAYEMKSYTLEGVGKVNKRTNSGSNLNPKKVREMLILEGLEPDRVEEIIDQCTKTWSTDYIELKFV